MLIYFGGIGAFFKNYANFRGRARRREFWMAWISVFTIGLAIIVNFVLDAETEEGVSGGLFFYNFFWALPTLIPRLSLYVRRLHDTGRRWYCIFMYLIPIYGIVCFFMYNCADSAPDNQWGPNPKRLQDPKDDGIRPPYAQPQQPPYAQPQYNQPQYAQPAQPQYNQPQYAQPMQSEDVPGGFGSGDAGL